MYKSIINYKFLKINVINFIIDFKNEILELFTFIFNA